ncbi:MAG: hypothetical protein IKQ16_09270 [Lentisphaeria bacterium]|nr:hypothetical protein [Lentisphaeria bacterium]
MTIHPCLFPTLFVAAVSVAAAAALRRTVRKEYTSLLPWLMPWGILCTFPALAFAFLCLPPFADTADWLNREIAGTWFEPVAGIAGVLPGLLWDEMSERLEANRELPSRLPAAVLRAAMVTVLLILILLPYGFLFNHRPAAQNENEAAQAVSELMEAAPIPDTEANLSTDAEASELKD